MNDWEDGDGDYSDGYYVYFEQLDGIEFGNEDDSLNPLFSKIKRRQSNI